MNTQDNGIENILGRFAEDVSSHEMTIIRDDDAFRHIHFERPNDSAYEFSITTWPGHLAITGDMGASVFSRTHDMFEFFRKTSTEKHPINPDYWSQKLIATDDVPRKFSASLFEQIVRGGYETHIAEFSNEDGTPPEWADALWAALKRDVLARGDSLDEAINAMSEFKFSCNEADNDTFEFADAWECADALTDFDFRLIWRMFAIVYAIDKYDVEKKRILTDAGGGSMRNDTLNCRQCGNPVGDCCGLAAMDDKWPICPHCNRCPDCGHDHCENGAKA